MPSSPKRQTRKSPKRSPRKTPKRSPRKTLKRSPRKTPKRSSPRKSPAKTYKPNGNFIAFSNAHRAEVMAKHPTWKVTQVAKYFGEQWRAMTPSQKVQYQF